MRKIYNAAIRAVYARKTTGVVFRKTVVERFPGFHNAEELEKTVEAWNAELWADPSYDKTSGVDGLCAYEVTWNDSDDATIYFDEQGIQVGLSGLR